jgi:hypothetical protein
MDKNKIMIEFLQTCPTIKDNPLFFNFGKVEDDAHQVTINTDDVAIQKPYIDGSVLKRYTYSIDSFKSVSCIPILECNTDENIEDFAEVQSLLDWINEQGENLNFPDFGENISIEEMKTLMTKPALIGVESSLNPPMAIYRIVIQIDYIDNSNRLWK